MEYQKVHKSSSWNPTSQAKDSQFATRPFSARAQEKANRPPTQEEIENQAFMENKHEASGLQLQAKYDMITPEGQERLTVLQTKMDAFRHNQLESRPRQGTSLLEIPNLFAPRETPQPIQPKLKIGRVGDKYEQQADQVAAKVVSQMNAPQIQSSAQSEALQREEMRDEEGELQMKPMVQRQPEVIQRMKSIKKVLNKFRGKNKRNREEGEQSLQPRQPSGVESLSAMTCWQSVAEYLYILGTLDQPPPIVDVNTVEHLMVSRGDQIEKAPGIQAGRVVGIFRVDENGQPVGSIQHVMYSLGGGRCMGSNNGCIGASPAWSEVDLNTHFNWAQGFPRVQEEVQRNVPDRYSRRRIVSIPGATAAQRLSSS